MKKFLIGILILVTSNVWSMHHKDTASPIIFAIDLLVTEGKVEEAISFTKKITKHIKSTEKGTVIYEYYFTPDGKKCFLYETYKNSDAALRHVNDFVSGDFEEEFSSYFTINSFQVLGLAKLDLKLALKEFTSDFRTLEEGFKRSKKRKKSDKRPMKLKKKTD
jgi:quinol monooxygenase YgiN